MPDIYMGAVAFDVHGVKHVCIGKDVKSYWCFVAAADDPRMPHRGPFPIKYYARFRHTLENRFPGWSFPDADVREACEAADAS